MDKRKWLERLRRELYKLPQSEVEDALAYYTEYFEDAGPEHEQEVLEELGSPSRVAAQIKADYAARSMDEGSEESAGERPKRRLGTVISAAFDRIMAHPRPHWVNMLLALLAGIVMVLLALVLLCAFVGVAIIMVGCVVVFGFGIVTAFNTVTGGLVLIGAGLAGAAAAFLLLFAMAKGTSALVRAAREHTKTRQKNFPGGYNPGGYDPGSHYGSGDSPDGGISGTGSSPDSGTPGGTSPGMSEFSAGGSGKTMQYGMTQ